MPQIKALGKTIDDMTDQVISAKICSILRELGIPGIERAMALVGILFEGHDTGLDADVILNWDRISQEDAEFITPIIQELNNIRRAFKDMPAPRKDKIFAAAKDEV
jgi:hypothetical protein